jgi:hypothetical protein
VSTSQDKTKRHFLASSISSPSFSPTSTDYVTTNMDEKALSACLKELASNMPINAQGEMKAHHWDARTPKWNEQNRWDPMGLEAPCTIWYIGGNTHGHDGVRLQNDYPCSIVVFEPVPEYAAAVAGKLG